MLCRFTTYRFRAVRPQPPVLLQNTNVNLLAKIPMSISSPKCQCQSPRPNANVNLLAPMPMSISSPKSQCPPPRQTANVSPFAKMHHPRAPYSISVLSSPCRPHSKLSNPWNTSSAVLPRFGQSLSSPDLCAKIRTQHQCTCAPHEDYQFDLPTSILTFCFSCHLLEASDEDAMLGPRSRFPSFSVISSLI
jgi:hypothetical protein